MIQIRTADASDASAIADLHAQSWRMTYRGIFSDAYLQDAVEKDRQTHWKQMFSQPASDQHVIVAFDATAPAQLLGFTRLVGQADPEFGTLVDNLHAHPGYKKSGVGRFLLNHAARWSAAHFPSDGMHLWVAAQNEPAIGFYRHLGGIEESREMHCMPDGKQTPMLRYIWPQAAQLITLQ